MFRAGCATLTSRVRKARREMAFWINIDEGGGGEPSFVSHIFGDILELMVKIVQIPIRYSHKFADNGRQRTKIDQNEERF